MVSLTDMRHTLLSLDEVRNILAVFEPLQSVRLEVGNTHFIMEEGWNHDLAVKEGTDLVNVTLIADNSEYQLTKDAVLQAGGLCGLTQPYIKKTPASLIEPQLNYWYGEQGLSDRSAQLLVASSAGAAVTRQSIRPFSNLRIINSILDGVEDMYGRQEVLVDPKFHHSLAETHLRLILPDRSFQVHDSGVDDDEWFVGLNLFNSLSGKGKTSLDGYLFRWWCSNGAVDRRASSGTWVRLKDESDENDLYMWARLAVEDVLKPLEGAQGRLQEMVDHSIEGDVNLLLADLFEGYGLPARDKKAIIAQMVEEDDLTMYSLMQAVTYVASHTELSAIEQTRLMSVGGDLPYAAQSRCSTCHRLSHDH